MKTKFTSGKWVVEELVTCCVIYSEDRVKRVIGEFFRAEDAHLIAAAPDMYRLLERLERWGDIGNETLKGEIGTLLAKARGEL